MADARDGGEANPTATKVWDILSALSDTPDAERRRRLLLVLHAYIDDSGQTGPPVFVLAGYIGRAERWAEFSDAWKAALAGPPALDFFKMHQAFHREGQFKGWDVETRDERLRLLSGIIRDHVMSAAVVVVRHEDYRATLRGRADRFIDRPYSLAYYTMLGTLLEWEIRNGLDEPIDFIFDEQMHDSDEVQAGFSKMLEAAPPEYRRRFGQRPVHRNDKDVVALQAADMLAWHVRRTHQALSEGERFGTAATPTLWSMHCAIRHVTRAELADLAARLGSDRPDADRLFDHEMDYLEQTMDGFVTKVNTEAIKRSEPSQEIALLPIPANEMRRYLLIHRCERCDRPHLH